MIRNALQEVVSPLLPGPRRSAPGMALACAALAAGVLLATGATGAARAIPRLDLRPYPTATAGERRWVIQLPGVLPVSTDPLLSPNPSDWRVELLIGRELEIDCNEHRFGGRLRRETLQGWGYDIYRVSDVGPMVSTRRACPPGEGVRRAFVPMGSKPFVVPWNASLPIVIYAPRDLEVRWRVWRAERRQQPAIPR